MRLISNFGISRRMMMLASLASVMVFARVAVGPLTFTWLYLTGSQWSLANPHDYFTWILEAAPGADCVFLLAATDNSFRWRARLPSRSKTRTA